MKEKYYFYKDDPSEKIYHVDHLYFTDGEWHGEYGPILISFDGKKIYNLWTNLPWDFSDAEIKIIKEENEFWADLFNEREGTKKPDSIESGFPIIIDADLAEYDDEM